MRAVLAAGIACMLLCASALGSGRAYAHATLVKSDPGRRAVLKTAPKAIKLWFSERIEPAYSSLWLVDSRGARVSGQAAAVSSADPKLLTLALDALPPGVYQVHYRVLSVDGHSVEASFSFSVKSTP